MVSLTARALQSLMRTRTIRNTKAITKAKAIGGHWGVNIDDAGHINKFQLTDKHGDVLISRLVWTLQKVLGSKRSRSLSCI